MELKVKELKIKVYSLKDIHFKETNKEITSLIDKALSKNEKYLKLHKQNDFKYYTFNMLYPLEESKIYKEGNIYTFIFRSVNHELAHFILKNIVNEYTDKIKVLTANCSVIPQRMISEIYSITPVIIKCDEGYWKNNISVSEFEKRLKDNIIKKYNSFFNTKIEEDFELFNFIKFNNKKPVGTKIKNITILGDKLNINIAENAMAQKLAYFMLGAGLSEMNARGFGFVNYKWVK